jgi:hypothetical protein
MPFLLLGVLLFLFWLPLLLSVLCVFLLLFGLSLLLSVLSMLLRGFGLLVFGRSFLGMIFLFVLLVVLGG